MRRVSSFHDPRFFPAYHELPPEQDVDLRFFGSTDGTIFFPRRHWCFLGEITQVEHNDDELRVLVRDRAGMLVVVGFGQEASSEILSTLVIGHTMAILYAYGNAFMGMSIGIRVQDPSEVKILPIGIDHLIAISDRARRYAPTEDMMSVCHGCGHRARLVLKCGRCGFFPILRQRMPN
eukprot:Protomagalhaensia_sp_Gyna_25__901@NODE_1434_length_1839_cov_33_141667_g1158_i0_p2_GENE_NODE_1434_length_1839_cov_33_141667_g1158_i0NODE_1434_length_1839_cov_33_141667_g1158_i0_p2_ORF_typecomplete_len178_score22_38_NODE_1434_length_1839_cov_33_141667_g1158_i012051738